MDEEIIHEVFDEEHLKAIEDFRREVLLEWRNAVQEALDGGAAANNSKKTKSTKRSRRARKSPYDIRSSFSSSTLSSSQLPPPDYEASWRSKLAIWPWLLRASHSCGITIVAFTKSTTLAVENCNYRDSFNALGVDNVEYQWQTWDLSLTRRSCDPTTCHLLFTVALLSFVLYEG